MRRHLSDLDKKDEEITQLVQSGDVEFFGVLVDRYEKKIKNYGRKFLKNKADIEDTTQDVFLKAYKNIQGFDAKRKFSSWSIARISTLKVRFFSASRIGFRNSGCRRAAGLYRLRIRKCMEV